MSYLPRMSKTYKEPQPLLEELEEDISGNILKPASSLLNEKTHNPLMVLKHYRYFPHAPPVLPGPSVLDEVLEDELFREASRMRRSATKMESFSKASEIVAEQLIEEPKEILVEDKKELTEKLKRTQSKIVVKGNKNRLSKKKSSKTVKRENTSDALVTLCLVETKKPFTATESERKHEHLTGDSHLLTKNELKVLKREKSTLPICNEISLKKTPKSISIKCLDEKKSAVQEFRNRSVQCTIFGSLSKLFVIPTVINSLLRTLAFLLHEINKEEAFSCTAGEKKTLMTQIQLILGDLCNQRPEKELGFDTTYSDYKRLEKLFGDLKKYMKNTYGDKGEYFDKIEDLKRAFIGLKEKEMESVTLVDKLQEMKVNPKNIVLKDSDLENPEITLQNKRLESDQLLAEVEFSRIELKNIQKSIAELEWDIKNSQGQMTGLKKSTVSKSKTEVLGRKNSIIRYSGEILAKRSKSKESENSNKKKT